MAGLLFASAILAALGAVGWRRLARSRQARALRQELARREGYSADRPLRIAHFSEMDDFVDLARCPCGGLLDRVGEGGRPGVRVTRTVCLQCEEEVDLFFDLSGLRH